MKARFGSDDDFMRKVTPDTQVHFAAKPESAIMGDYPTLRDIDSAYGKGFSVEWLIPQISNLALYTGAKNLNDRQQLELARVISVEYRHLKITEILMFFARFKAGRYGRFYGSVDPMVITCALRDFIKERNIMIDSFEQKKREEESHSEDAMSREEWEEIKMLTRMYEMQINRK